MTKKEEFKLGYQIIMNFCIVNNIKIPSIIVTTKIKYLGYYHLKKPSNIFINLKKCDRISKKKHPAMIHECTIIGTMLHEFGHYLHYGYFPKLTKKFKKIKKEPIIHYFERDIEEDIAESIRLFILHPARLVDGRQKRYEILNKIFINRRYYPLSLYALYNEKHEKIDIDRWNKFLV